MKADLGCAWRATATAAALLTICGCQGETSGERNAPAQEVLPGSVSDAMLPIDTVRSSPPLAPQTGTALPRGAGEGGRDSTAQEEEATGASEPATAEPAPATGASAAPSGTE